MAAVERDLPVREPQLGEAGGRVDLVAEAVACLLSGSAVVTQAVGLDDEPELRPEEVDPEAVDVGAGLGERQPGRARQRLEAALELGVGEGEGAAVEQLAQSRETWAPCQRVQLAPQAFGIDEVLSVGLVDRGLQGAGIEGGGARSTSVSAGFVTGMPARRVSSRSPRCATIPGCLRRSPTTTSMGAAGSSGSTPQARRRSGDSARPHRRRGLRPSTRRGGSAPPGRRRTRHAGACGAGGPCRGGARRPRPRTPARATARAR